MGGSLDVILQADAATGRAHSLVYVARGPENRYGSIVVTYRDFRTVDGLVVPFEETGTFDGQGVANSYNADGTFACQWYYVISGAAVYLLFRPCRSSRPPRCTTCRSRS